MTLDSVCSSKSQLSKRVLTKNKNILKQARKLNSDFPSMQKLTHTH